MKNRNEKKQLRGNSMNSGDAESRSANTPLLRGNSVDNDLRNARRIAYSNGDRDAFDTIYGSPGEYPAMEF